MVLSTTRPVLWEAREDGQKCDMCGSSSLRDIPDLGPKGAYLGVKLSVPPSPLTLPLYLGFPTGHAEIQDTLPGGLASVKVEIHKVLTVVMTMTKKYTEVFMGLTLLYELT